MKNSKKLLVYLTVSLLAVLNLSAQVVLDTSGSQVVTGTTGTLSNFTISSTDNVLVAVVSVRANASDGPTAGGVTFGSDAFTELTAIPYTENGGAGLGFYYLTNPTATSGDMSVTIGGGNGDAYFAVYSLSNADPNVSNWSASTDFGNSGDDFDLSLNGVSADSFIIDGVSQVRGDPFVATDATRSGTIVNGLSSGTNAENISLVSSYISGASGNYTLGYTSEESFAYQLGAIAVTAIPEPSAFALMIGALCLGLAMRRRRHI